MLVKEHPILFGGPMVRAILAGTKTQTRRIVKITRRTPGLAACLTPPAGLAPMPRTAALLCRYGQPGDRLWVRETWTEESVDAEEGHYRPDYRATANGQPLGKWKPSIHMPRWASRITLEITGVRVERLQEISEDDAKAEGATERPVRKPWGREPGWSMDWSRVGQTDRFGSGGDCNGHSTLTESDICLSSARWAFANYIDKINGPGSWDANPWVWVVEFRRLP